MGSVESFQLYLHEIYKAEDYTPLPSAELLELCRQAQNGDANARDKVFCANLQLVVSIARAYSEKGVPFEDAVQDGNIGLLHALERYNCDSEVKFTTYAYYWIHREIQKASKQMGKIINLPEHFADQLNLFSNAVENLTTKLGYVPSDSEIAKHLNISELQVSRFKQYSFVFVSLDSLVNDPDTYDLSKRISLSIDQELSEMCLRADIQELFVVLSPKEIDIIKRRFGILPYCKPQLLFDIATAFGCSRENVRQFIVRAIMKMKNFATAKGWEIGDFL